MLETIIYFDKKLFLWLNGLHTPTLDIVMSFLSNNFILLVIVLGLFLYDKFKEKGLKFSFLSLVFILLGTGISDLISTRLLKDTIKRPRPCYTKDIKPQVHSVGSCFGGRYGFVSSHASNSMFFAVLLVLMAKKKKTLYKLLIPYSILVSYSRIYVGKHYPLDVFFGMILGLVLGALVFKLWAYANQKHH
jgi:undecaprenyl-diphosphatase